MFSTPPTPSFLRLAAWLTRYVGVLLCIAALTGIVAIVALIAITFGLFILVINFVLFWFTIWLSGVWDLGLTSDGLISTFLGALVVSIVSTVLNWFVD